VLGVYTMEQVRLFEEAGRRNAAFDLAEEATAFRMAMSPKEAAWKKYVNLLSRRTRREKRKNGKPPAVMTREQMAELKRMYSRKVV
jgi:hypothetical protein